MTTRTLRRLVLGLLLNIGTIVVAIDSSRSVMASTTSGVQEDQSKSAEESPRLAAGESMTVGTKSNSVSLTLETERPESGVPIIFLVRVAGNTDDALELPRPGAILGPFEVLDDQRRSDPATSDSAPLPRHLVLRTFDAGLLELPAITAGFGVTTVTFSPRSIDVASVAGLDAGPENFRDITDAVKVKAPVDWWFMTVVAFGAIAILAILAFFWWRARQPKSLPLPEPADQWALSALERLAERQLPHAGQIEPFFTELTDIARAFIERRFRIAAPERTTQEFIAEARTHSELTAEQAQRLARLLRAADLVKFAGNRPVVTDCDRALEVTRGFVIEAGPRIEVESSSSPQADTPTATRSNHRGEREFAIHRAVDGLDDLEGRS
ncbi:MAG: hypothetical protein QMB94_00910 [Phycisphaerales bacterium]